MRIPINLSNEPFRRDRPMLLASAAVAVLMVASLALFVSMAVAERQRSATARGTVAQLTAELGGVSREQARVESVLRMSENADVLEKTQFINKLLMRKGVSWTKLFSDLEKVVPHNVRLISVRPQITARNEIILDMVVGAQTPEPVVNLLMALESAPEFGATNVHNSLPPSQTDPLYRYRLSVQYAQKL